MKTECKGRKLMTSRFLPTKTILIGITDFDSHKAIYDNKSVKAQARCYGI